MFMTIQEYGIFAWLDTEMGKQLVNSSQLHDTAYFSVQSPQVIPATPENAKATVASTSPPYEWSQGL